MSQPAPPAQTVQKDSQTGQEQPKRPLQRLLEAIGLSGMEQPPQQQERIIAPVSVDRLIELLMETTVESREEEGESKNVQVRVKHLTMLVQQLARTFINVYLTDGLGRIYHPLYSVPVVEARLATLAQLLAKTVAEITEDMRQLATSKQVSADEYASFVREAELAIQLSFLVLPEVYNQLMTLYYINAPPELRPPLVNAALGYEIVGRERKKRLF